MSDSTSSSNSTHHRRVRSGRLVAVVMGAVLLVVLVGPLFVPIRPAPDTVDPRELAYPDSRFVEVDNIRFHYTDQGSRDATCTILLLHGFGANTMSWSQTTPFLAGGCRVVTFDRPAFGLTERPAREEWASGNPYSMDAHAEQTVRLMDALGIERATLVGHSAGGAVAVQVARRHPDRVDALVLEDPAVYEEGVYWWLGPLLRSPQARHLGPLLVRRFAPSTADSLLARAHFDPSVATTELAEGYFRPFAATDWDRALWEFAIAPRSAPTADSLGGLTVPTLVIAGRQDRIVPFADAQRAAQAIPGATFIPYERTGHVPHEEHPARFADDVLAFISGVSSGLGE